VTFWNAQETEVLHNFISQNDYLQIGIRKFLDAQAQENEYLCTQAMATVPRDPERASDYAAKADAYRTLWKFLEAEVKRQVKRG